MCIAASRKCGIEISAIQQLYRASTSVGANIREAQYAESPKDFVHKLKIAEKELGEVFYWLGLLTAEPTLLTPEIVAEISLSATSLVKLLSVIITKTKMRLEKS
ncbi:MAG: four helix bundle protein [Candidatus Kapabacteria bacterium]|nr:four helix bundle protein [Candidatus Kapabacteria bacterium]